MIPLKKSDSTRDTRPSGARCAVTGKGAGGEDYPQASGVCMKTVDEESILVVARRLHAMKAYNNMVVAKGRLRGE